MITIWRWLTSLKGHTWKWHESCDPNLLVFLVWLVTVWANMIIGCYPRSECMTVIKVYYYKWWLYTPDGIILSHTLDGAKVNVSSLIFRLGLFYNLLYSIKIYIYNIDIKWILGNDMNYVFHNWHINLIKQGWIFSAQTNTHEKCYK